MAHGVNMLRLDLRDLPAPEPLERILECLDTLRRGERLVALTPRPPLPLLPILDEGGFAYHVYAAATGTACIAICHAEDKDTLRPPRAA